MEHLVLVTFGITGIGGLWLGYRGAKSSEPLEMISGCAFLLIAASIFAGYDMDRPLMKFYDRKIEPFVERMIG